MGAGAQKEHGRSRSREGYRFGREHAVSTPLHGARRRWALGRRRRSARPVNHARAPRRNAPAHDHQPTRQTAPCQSRRPIMQVSTGIWNGRSESLIRRAPKRPIFLIAMITTSTGSRERAALPGCFKRAPGPTRQQQASLRDHTAPFYFSANARPPPRLALADHAGAAAASIPRVSSSAGIARPSLLQRACLCVLFPSSLSSCYCRARLQDIRPTRNIAHITYYKQRRAHAHTISLTSTWTNTPTAQGLRSS